MMNGIKFSKNFPYRHGIILSHLVFIIMTACEYKIFIISYIDLRSLPYNFFIYFSTLLLSLLIFHDTFFI